VIGFELSPFIWIRYRILHRIVRVMIKVNIALKKKAGM